MSYRREVLRPRMGARRFARICAAVGIAIGLVIAANDHVSRHTKTTRRFVKSAIAEIERLEHDVKWCGRRVDSLRMRSRPVHFIAAPTGKVR